jgi:hypothetical protein
VYDFQRDHKLLDASGLSTISKEAWAMAVVAAPVRAASMQLKMGLSYIDDLKGMRSVTKQSPSSGSGFACSYRLEA